MEPGENILTLKQVDTIINNIPKLEARCDKKAMALLFKIMYHGMLTVSEVLQLTVRDINLQKKELNVIAKGGKQETTFFSLDSVWNEIANYIKNLEPDAKLFTWSRQMMDHYAKRIGELSDIKMSHMTKDTSGLYLDIIRHSRKHHLDNSSLFRESELDQISRNYGILKQRGYAEYPVDTLKRKEEEANQILLTYCESCNYKNPERAKFCCFCSKSLSEHKSIIR